MTLTSCQAAQERAELWSFLAVRLNLGRGRSSLVLSPLAASLQLPCSLKQREEDAGSKTSVPPLERRFKLSLLSSKYLLPHFPCLIHVCPSSFRSKGPGQTRGAQSSPIPTAIKASSRTAVQCCVDHSIPGKSLRPRRHQNHIQLCKRGLGKARLTMIWGRASQHKHICFHDSVERVAQPAEKGWRWLSAGGRTVAPQG